MKCWKMTIKNRQDRKRESSRAETVKQNEEDKEMR